MSAACLSRDLKKSPFIGTLIAPYHILDEGHAAEAFFHGGEVHLFGGGGPLVQSCRQREGKIPVEITECLQVAFGMPTGSTTIVRSKGREPVTIIGSGAQGLRRGIQPFYQQGVG